MSDTRPPVVTAALCISVTRALLGTALFLMPSRLGRLWVGDVANEPGSRAALRSAGASDAAIGLGAALALRSGRSAAGWMVAGAGSDLADLVATSAAGPGLPGLSRLGVSAFAGAGAALCLYLARGLREAAGKP